MKNCHGKQYTQQIHLLADEVQNPAVDGCSHLRRGAGPGNIWTNELNATNEAQGSLEKFLNVSDKWRNLGPFGPLKFGRYGRNLRLSAAPGPVSIN